jgi:hypothetical protein
MFKMRALGIADVLPVVLASALAATFLFPATRGAVSAQVTASNNPIDVLSSILATNPDARKDVGERFARFLKSKDAKGRQYLAADLQANKGDVQMVNAVARLWPDLNKDNPGNIAALYFVMGPDGDLPSWAQNPALAGALRPDMELAGRLQEALARRHWTDSAQLLPGCSIVTVVDFLNDASKQAREVVESQSGVNSAKF